MIFTASQALSYPPVCHSVLMKQDETP